MVKNYLKVAFRNVLRRKGFSFINIFGLSVGLACCILIFLYVQEEFTFDKFHSKSGRIYRAWVLEDYGEGKVFHNTVTPGVLGPTLQSHYPEIEGVARLSNAAGLMRKDGQIFNETIFQAGSDFFKIFDFETTEGSVELAMNELSSIIITEKAAKKYFGVQQAVGNTMQIQLGSEFQDFQVRAVIEDIPANSSIQFDYLISDLHFKTLFNPRVLNSWTNIMCETYVLLDESNQVTELEAKFPAMMREVLQDFDGSYTVGLQKLTDIHLDPEMPIGFAPVSDPKYSYILSAIAILILIVAAVNFTTLSLGLSIVRAKEVGVRKVAGAERRQLTSQFMAETFMITGISLLMGLLLSVIGLPLFNDLAGKSLVLTASAGNIAFLLLLALLITFVAGSYPALVLSGFKPIMVLKNEIKVGRGKQTLRKVLVIAQFVFSIFLIASTLIMQAQIDFLRDKDLGFKKDQIVVVPMSINPGRYVATIQAGREESIPFKNELEKIPEIMNVGIASHTVGTGGWSNAGFTDTDGNFRSFNINCVDEDYLPAMQIELAMGRNFDHNIPSDVRRSIIINESFAREYGWDDPLREKLPGDFEDHEIIGVVKDFNYESLHGQVSPLLIVMDPSVVFGGISDLGVGVSITPKLLISVQSEDLSSTLDKIQAVWDKLNPGEEFTFSFVDQTLDAQYENDRHLGKVVSSASILAILIGSLGLLGLASLSMASRTREISLRKVLGASNQGLFMLLGKDFLIMILIALVLAVPITYFLMSDWLSEFSYKISISPLFFAVAGGISLLAAFLTIAYHALKTILTNPVENLRHE